MAKSTSICEPERSISSTTKPIEKNTNKDPQDSTIPNGSTNNLCVSECTYIQIQETKLSNCSSQTPSKPTIKTKVGRITLNFNLK